MVFSNLCNSVTTSTGQELHWGFSGERPSQAWPEQGSMPSAPQWSPTPCIVPHFHPSPSSKLRCLGRSKAPEHRFLAEGKGAVHSLCLLLNSIPRNKSQSWDCSQHNSWCFRQAAASGQCLPAAHLEFRAAGVSVGAERSETTLCFFPSPTL